jgi:glycerophosphoryl diester phosphodiesterase
MTALMLVAYAVLGAAPPQFAPLPPVKHRVAVIAHRGGRALGPENTLAAFRKAIKLGVDYIEIDVRQTRDGKLVIMHDPDVGRTTSGTGQVADLDFATIRSLDAGSKFGAEYAGEKVPTLKEVLALAYGKVSIYLDHKAGRIADIISELKAAGPMSFSMAKHVVVYGPVHVLQAWKRYAPEIPVMPSLPSQYRRAGGIRDFFEVLRAEVLDGNTSDYTADLVHQAHAVGLKVYVDSIDDVDNEAGWQKALDLGVDGIQTDHPDNLMVFLKYRRAPIP